MKKRLKRIAVNAILVCILIVTIYLGYVGFIGGPKRAYEREDRLFVEAMMKQEGYTEAKLLNRFSFDEVYYIIDTVNDAGERILVWSNKGLNKSGDHLYAEKDTVRAQAESLGFKDEPIQWGVYKERLVFVIKNETREVFIDLDSREVVYDFKGVL